jgi:gluconokinase
VAEQLVERLGWPFAEGDTFHPAANVAKMRDGIPLVDDDRWPWLQALADWIGAREAAGENAVVTCSALKRSYRELLRTGHPSVWFAHVDTSPDVLRERVTSGRVTTCRRRCSTASSRPWSGSRRTSPA